MNLEFWYVHRINIDIYIYMMYICIFGDNHVYRGDTHLMQSS